jgi:DUF4097 and DUF4098 domain-containing protein YvlB
LLSGKNFEMKLKFYIVIALLASLLVCGLSAQAQKAKDKGKGQGAGRGEGAGQGKGQGEGSDSEKGIEAAISTTPNVNVILMSTTGKLTVRGWDRNEVHAQTTEPDSKIKLRKTGGTDAANPTMRLDIVVVPNNAEDPEEEEAETCSEDADVTIDVPRGATIYLKTENGDVDVDGVAEAHIETSDGRIEARRISKSIEVSSVGGDIALEDASGRARLSSINGVIEARDLRLLDGSDFLKIKTVSGDILLDRIGAPHVEAQTISGELRLTGPLARGGSYNFTTTNGDVTLLLPTESSFKLNAKISENGEIITQFPLTYKSQPSSTSVLQGGRLVGTYGSGDANITLVSFSGTLQLRKQ